MMYIVGQIFSLRGQVNRLALLRSTFWSENTKELQHDALGFLSETRHATTLASSLVTGSKSLGASNLNLIIILPLFLAFFTNATLQGRPGC